ncbi:redoxin domain-containing protein [Salisediminibacterium beveridgei]|uniref:Alkyl hydroperoxide reductase subunit C/ Thiol specific antioxidant domain-containing protein n=1 Tax=Salisediminibacterium beveridgei TaxID=632773 RepID=A0A1D7QST5_9BACI|nr:redoxin domain-containing protein [Salisediminibacterium beveridgei]AOM82074.1 hypothetical protein BBEV_0702 [Salisediminibacterium beveridgei]
MIEEVEALGYTVYGVSPSSPEEHRDVIEQTGLAFDLLTDMNYEVGSDHGFVDLDEGLIFRGYTAVNPETGEQTTEVDYLVGENKDEILEVLEDL